ncbi:MAG: SLC13 family permease [Desulfobacterales bacterium]|nr:SLC13 family permease [Desulfobacterales bacterium]
MAIWIVSLILISTLVLLITERIPVDLTAIGIVVALMVTGILTPVEAVRGFANPAVVTVAAMFLISRAMIRTGAVGFIGQKVLASSGGRPQLAYLMVLGIVAVASAFINNTPVVVLFIPVVLTLSCDLEISPSKLLIPVSYASILAGTCTLIGTSTNIIVSDLSDMYAYGQLGMFELSTLGVPIAVVGIAILFFLGPRILPGLVSPVCELDDSEHRIYLAELVVPKKSPLIGQAPETVFDERFASVKVAELIRYNHIYYPPRDSTRISADDLLLVRGSANDLVELLQDGGVELTPSEKDLKFDRKDQDAVVVELIIPPQSSLIGERLYDTQLKRDPDVKIIAIKRIRLHWTEKNLEDARLKNGDILLIQCPVEKLDQMRGRADFIIVEDVHDEIVLRRKARQALVIFAGVIVGASTGLADILTCALTGAFLMILAGCLQLRDAYRALQPNVLLLIAGTIALGTAMEKTGASQFYAERFLGLFAGAGPAVVLAAFLLLTSISTQLLSNNATAVLLIPIAISTAVGLGVHPKPFIIAVCFGASACFASPIGYQTNLLVYGPGGYRFSDYLKLGIPLNLLVLVLGTVFIPVIWPF